MSRPNETPRPAPCCGDFEQALQHGTDNEMYGALISWYGDEFNTGCDLPPIKFCPWCGQEVQK